MKNNLPSYARFLRALTYLCVAGLLFFFWKQQNDLFRAKNEKDLLRAENERLLQELTSVSTAAAAESQRVAEAQVQIQTVTAMAAAKKRRSSAETISTQTNAAPDAAQHAADVASLVPAPDPSMPRLSLANTKVQSAPGSLTATMQFNASKAGPLGLVAVAIRLPKDSTAKVLDLTPTVGIEKYTDSTKEISGDGKFAFFQGTLEADAEVQFALSVTEPVMATVRGTRGIGPFQLNVQPNGASVESLR